MKELLSLYVLISHHERHVPPLLFLLSHRLLTADNEHLPVAILLHASVRLHLLGIILVTLVAVVVVVFR